MAASTRLYAGQEIRGPAHACACMRATWPLSSAISSSQN